MIDTAVLAQQEIFTPEVLEKAQTEFKRGKVLSMSWHDDGETILGRVKGSGQALLTAKVHLNDDGKTICCVDCTCTTSEINCRHAAAVYLAFLKDPGSVKSAPTGQSRRPPSDSPLGLEELIGSNSEHRRPKAEALDFVSLLEGMSEKLEKCRPVPPAWTLLPADLTRSLSRICTDNMLATMPADGDEFDEGVPPGSREAVYVVKTDNSETSPRGWRVDRINVVSAVVKRDGSYGSEKLIDILDSYNRPSDMLSAEDRSIIQLLRMLNFWEASAAVTKELGAAYEQVAKVLVERLVTTQRLRLDGANGRSLVIGAALPGRLLWLPSARDRLTLTLVAIKPEDTELSPLQLQSLVEQSPEVAAVENSRFYRSLAWRSPWYVDAAAGVIGQIDCSSLGSFDLVSQSLSSLRSISPEEALPVANALADLGLSAKIPLPPCSKAKAEVRLVNIKPQLVVTSLHTQDKSDGGGHQRSLLLTFPPNEAVECLVSENGRQ
ncbi:MAG TPA: hypothetical protein V6C72_04320, partial [Chroococcales cyanobacterium]